MGHPDRSSKAASMVNRRGPATYADRQPAERASLLTVFVVRSRFGNCRSNSFTAVSEAFRTLLNSEDWNLHLLRYLHWSPAFPRDGSSLRATAPPARINC